MSILVLHPRLYAKLLEQEAMPHRSLAVRQQIKKLRAKKREENRIQINLTEEDAQNIAGIIYSCDLCRWDSSEGIRSYMEGIAKAGLTSDGMGNSSYVSFSSSEWKAMIEIASGLESTLDLDKIPTMVLYDFAQFYDEWFESYLRFMVGRSYGYRDPNEYKEEQTDPAELGGVAFGAVEEANENGDSANGNNA